MAAVRLVPLLPWDVTPEEKRRFQNLVFGLLFLTLVLGLMMPFLPTFEQEKVTKIKPPERIVKLVLEQKKKKVPPPPKLKPKPKPKPAVKEKPKPKPKPEVKEVKKKPIVRTPPKPEKKPSPSRARAKETARKQAAAFDALDDLRDDSVFSKMDNTRNLTTAGSSTKAAGSTRNILASRSGRSSGGIQTGRASRSSGSGSSLSSRGSTKVKSNIVAGGDGIAKRSRSGGGMVRSDENISLTFERAKGSLNALYRRAAKKDPLLQGKVVFYLEIAPSGKVLKVSIKSSDLNNPTLEKKLLAKIRRLDFKPSKVVVWKGNYSIDFLPG